MALALGRQKEEQLLLLLLLHLGVGVVLTAQRKFLKQGGRCHGHRRHPLRQLKAAPKRRDPRTRPAG